MFNNSTNPEFHYATFRALWIIDMDFKMKNFAFYTIFLLSLMIELQGWLCYEAEASEFHVSVNTGSDENNGTLSAPFKTLEKARDIARSTERSEGEIVTIYIHPGDYYCSQTIQFGNKDYDLLITAWDEDEAGERRKDNGTYKSENRKLPRFFGGVQVRNWQKSNFRSLENVYEADVSAIPLTKRVRQLFYDGIRQTWCRYPNYDAQHPFSGGWAYVDGEVFNMYKDVEGERCDLVKVKEKDYRHREKPEEGMICLFPRYNWWNVALGIKEVDNENRTLTLEKSMLYAARPADRYHMMGYREDIDVPGEWYHDVEAKKLYFIPPDAKLMETSVTIPLPAGIFALSGSKNITFRGLDLCDAEEYGVKFDQCKNCRVEKSLLHDMVFFSGATVQINGGERCQVLGCDIWNSGGHGIMMNGGDTKNFLKAEHNVENNYIHHCGQLYRHGIGIMVYGVGSRLAHNRIHDMPRCGIFHGGQRHTIEFNDIYFTNLEMEDTGAIYGGGWTGGLGTVIRYNRCSDSIGFGHDREGKYHFYMFAWGIYLDEACCGVDVYGNIVERCQIGAMHLHNARENHITNNIFVSNAGREGKSRQISFQGWNNDPNAVFLRDRQPKQLKSYETLLAANPEWGKMRGMHISPANPFLPDGTMMRGNRVERNIFYYPDQPESTYATASNMNFEHNTIDHNIIFSGGAPIKTGRRNFATVLGAEGDNVEALEMRIDNVTFKDAETAMEQAKNPNKTVACGWSWYCKTLPEIRSEIVKNVEGVNALRIYAGFNDEKMYIKNSCIRSTAFTLEPGKDYALTFRLRMSEGVERGVKVRFVTENKGLWKAFGQQSFRPVKTSENDDFMKVCRTTFHFPLPNEPDYDERIDRLTLQFQMENQEGWFEISDIHLTEVRLLNEWESWQAEGADVHSVLSDPLFVAPEKGNYTLKPDSPALRMGFEQIPVDKIGTYPSEMRATWPIREAEGVRQHPEWLEEVEDLN